MKSRTISMARALVVLALGGSVPDAQAALCTFAGPGLPSIGEAAVSTQIDVGGIEGGAARVDVVLHGLRETVIGVEELDLLLVGPGDEEIVLMSFACIATTGPLDLDFSSDATEPIPSADFDTGAPCTSGTYLPGDYSSLAGGYLLKNNPPAPNPPYPGALSDLLGADPNGLWTLHAAAFSDLDHASLASWELRFDASSCGPGRIFADGFQSGDVSAWSAPVP